MGAIVFGAGRVATEKKIKQGYAHDVINVCGDEKNFQHYNLRMIMMIKDNFIFFILVTKNPNVSTIIPHYTLKIFLRINLFFM